MPPAKHLSLAQIVHWQRRIIRHDRWVIRTAHSHSEDIVTFHRAQLRWVSRELSQNLKRTIVSTAGIMGGLSCYSCWDRVANCESHNNWGEVTGNGFYWGLQWVPGTWDSAAKLARLPNFYWFSKHHTSPSREQQIAAASHMGLGNWPVCGARY